MSQTPTASGSVTLPVADRERIARLIDRYGESTVVQMLGVHRHVVPRAVAGLGIRRGTAAIITTVLASLPGESEKP